MSESDEETEPWVQEGTLFFAARIGDLQLARYLIEVHLPEPPLTMVGRVLLQRSVARRDAPKCVSPTGGRVVSSHATAATAHTR